jgi:hypothetical protein
MAEVPRIELKGTIEGNVASAPIDKIHAVILLEQLQGPASLVTVPLDRTDTGISNRQGEELEDNTVGFEFTPASALHCPSSFIDNTVLGTYAETLNDCVESVAWNGSKDQVHIGLKGLNRFPDFELAKFNEKCSILPIPESPHCIILLPLTSTADEAKFKEGYRFFQTDSAHDRRLARGWLSRPDGSCCSEEQLDLIFKYYPPWKDGVNDGREMTDEK